MTATGKDPINAGVRFATVIPVGAWHLLLPASLDSLARQDMVLNIAFLNASGDPYVRRPRRRKRAIQTHHQMLNQRARLVHT